MSISAEGSCVIRPRRSWRTISMDHIHTIWPKNSEKCSDHVCAPATYGNGLGAQPSIGMTITCAPMYTSVPKTAPCHIVMRGTYSAAMQ